MIRNVCGGDWVGDYHASQRIPVGGRGSLALEVISLPNEMKTVSAQGVPAYYKKVSFWIVRLLVTGIAGALAIAEKASSPLIAINIGASAPAILQLLTNPPKTPPSP
jgi:hypothetical protein